MKETILHFLQTDIGIATILSILGILGSVGGILFKQIWTWLGNKIKDQETKALFIKSQSVVMALWNTTMRETKKAFADGTITKAEVLATGALLKKQAIDELKEYAKNEVGKYAWSKIDDTVAGHMIETAISSCKNQGLMKKPLPEYLKDPARFQDTVNAEIKNQVALKFANPKMAVPEMESTLESPQTDTVLTTSGEMQ